MIPFLVTFFTVRFYFKMSLGRGRPFLDTKDYD